MTGNLIVSRSVVASLLFAAGLSLAGCRGGQGDAGANGTPCTVAANGNGTETITCPDGTSATVRNGSNGAAATCAVKTNADGTATITCSDGSSVTIHNGTNGTNGANCTATTNADGTKTITCPDGSSVTVTDGTSCTVAPGDGGEQITCGNTTVTVPNGTDGSSCSAKDNGDGTKTISCTNGTSVTVADGNTCSVHSNADGTKTLSCTDGTSVTIAPPLATNLDPYATFPGVVVKIVGVSGASNSDHTFAAGDTVSVDFTLATNAGVPIAIEQLDGAEIWLSGPTSNYQHILPAARDQQAFTDLATASVQNSDGSYTYRFNAPIPATYGVPLWNSATLTDGVLSGPLQAGTYAVSIQAHHDYIVNGMTYPDVGGDLHGFLFGHATALETREVVTTANCNGCHNRLQEHGGLYQATQLCATCHTAGAADMNTPDAGDPSPVSIEFRSLIHKIHNGAHLPSVNGVTTSADGSRNYDAGPVPFVVGGVAPEDFSDVQYPVTPSFQIAMPRNQGYSGLTSAQKAADDNIRKGVVACQMCHGSGSSVATITPPAQGNQYQNPSRAACGSCHDDIDWSKPYIKNGLLMPAQANDTGCTACHYAFYPSLDIRLVHEHPVSNAAVTPNLTFVVSAVTGGSGPGGAFKAGDSPSVTYSINDGAGNAVPITALDSVTSIVVGPTLNRQVPFPYATTNGISLSPYDFAGRLASPSTSGKGLMSRVVPTATSVTEPLVVQFTSPTVFTVTGQVSGALGGGLLPAAVGTNPSGSSIGTIYLTSAAIPQALTLTFSSPTAFSLLGQSGNTLGTGVLPAPTASSVWFTSTDGSISFSVTAGTTAFAAGNTIPLTVFKTAPANPVLFAVAAGRTAFATGDRFYYNFIAPAPTYTLHVPMDIPFELLGVGNGNAGQVFTTANLPAWYGYQTVYERTALPGAASALSTAVAFEGPYLPVSSAAGFAVNDYVVVDDGNAGAEYLQVGSVDAVNNRLWSTTPIRFTHASGATVKKATLTFRQEGTDYTLNAAGTVTLAVGSSNPFVVSYRTNGRFGWYRGAGDTLQTVYAPPPHNNPSLDETWGNWAGKGYVSGTYTLGIWGYKNVPFAASGEYQAYRAAARSARQDFLYGTATTVAPYSLLDTTDNCQSCHDDLSFHGGSRRDPGTCLLCHGVAGLGFNSYVPAPPPAGTSVSSLTGNFRTFIHNAHLDAFPVMPNGAGACSKCHGAATVWQSPTDRNHPTQQVKPVIAWQAACGGCHTSAADGAHFTAMSPGGVESCSVCHGPGATAEVSLMHAAR